MLLCATVLSMMAAFTTMMEMLQVGLCALEQVEIVMAYLKYLTFVH